LDSVEAADRFIDTADSAEYDLSGMAVVRFEFQPKTERVNMRLPKPLLDAVEASAQKAGMPYPRFIRQDGVAGGEGVWRQHGHTAARAGLV
jgi:predicted DNA binding CopG/RHH family protein